MNGMGFFSQHAGRNPAGDARAHLAGRRDDAAGHRDRRAARNSGGAAAMAFEANPRRREHRGNDSEPRAAWFLASGPWLGERADRLAITALTLYALLPIIRNTAAGITGVDPAVREAARGMGMTARQILFQVELPLSLSTVLAGIRVATVLTIGVATIAAAVGAGGLGEFIFRGLAMVNNQLILAGAIPAAALALLADFCLSVLERRLRPAR